MKTLTVASLPRQVKGWRPEHLEGQEVLVVGLGTFGGGVGVTRFLAEQGARVTVTDLRPAERLAESLAALEGLPVRFVLGEHRSQEVDRAEWLVASPAVPWSAPVLQRAALLGRPVETEISLLVRLLPGRWLGITGTNGKTTVATLASRALAGDGRSVLYGGNMGGSLLGRVGEMHGEQSVVLELSSFQLEHLADAGLGPDLAILTNVTPDHLDRHGSFEQYVHAKQGILRRAEGLIAHHGDPVCRRVARRFSGDLLWFGTRPAWPAQSGVWVREDHLEAPDGRRRDLGSFSLPGGHNKLNLAAAVAAAMRMGVDFDAAVDAAWGAEALPHRLHTLATIQGVRYVDDSVSTSPPAVLAALAAFPGRIRLLIGGYDKGIDTRELLDAMPRQCRKAYLFGAVAEALGLGLARRPRPADGPPSRGGEGYSRYPDLEAAFRAAVAEAEEGDVVLLSPGFASYDQFRNFTERGLLFQKLVEQLRVA